MPRKPPTPCGFVGCPNVSTIRFCPEHQREYYRRQDRLRGSSAERGYDVVWRRLRRLILAGEPLCRYCYSMGRITAAVEVDHIVPIAHGGARLDASNLQPLCRACHSAKTLNESVISH